MIITFDETITRLRKRHIKCQDFILPGFIDLQVNGAFGIDVMSASADELLRVSHRLAREGVTAWLPTAITAPLEAIERCDNVIAAAMEAQSDPAQESSALAGAAILGMHLEGPFISPRRLGAHPPLNLAPAGDALERVLALRSLKLITLAPELDGALDAIRRFVARHVAVSLGHSDATYGQALAGVDAGARMFTHVFNAMRPLHHREPGIIGAALTPSPAAAAMIPDHVHVHPAAFAAVRAARTVHQTLVTTDRVAVAGLASPSAPPLFGDRERQAKFRDGAARFPDGTLAGGAITLLDGLRLTLNDPVFGRELDPFAYSQMASTGPAHLLGLADRGAIRLGQRADLIMLDPALNLKAVFVGGREIE
jgi:N-acetylglucosamine-6-phosphate deacetylase